ncbi:hypothetical protein [Pleionea sp. CnH1-48]|uniref:hypothetical protein n=1 Tax=Pleionea sp. CnH1-48 TaxID=2954494 RepID=UPI002096CC51|nr:hypothetical protein [Pleionea sp. CnH1-48]MCO7226329.1 hypothetical protein [Pleionea sp. CnH1-48]
MKVILRSSLISCCLVLLVVTGCSHQSVKSVSELGDPACYITEASFNHILLRHCSVGGGSQLLAEYCTREGMQRLCGMIQHAPNKVRSVQSDGRVRYDANLGVAIGTHGELCGRLIIESTRSGNVITEFPENTGAPGSCRRTAYKTKVSEKD